MTNKLKYFVGNWKMFGDLKSFNIVNKINKFSKKTKNVYKNNKVILCVPSTLIYFYNKKLVSKSISLGAQNCHYNDDYGSFTGSVNAKMLKNMGAEYVIIGHSENRMEGDTNEIIKKKIKSAIKRKLNVIFCIGETLKEKKGGKTFSSLKRQIKNSLEKKINLKKIIFAYEPVWAVGSDKTPKTEELRKIIKFIKKNIKLKKLPKVLYGGSVNSKNMRSFSSISDIDGFLIGRASQSSKKFIDIIKNYYK
tara:strand:+ start:1858 stop:2607 length:750 start_codon:yes stop_codon:yes gene_type:complete